MARFKVALHRRIRDNYSGTPEPNPFLAPIPAPGKTHSMLLREWSFEARDEDEVRALLQQAYDEKMPQVMDFSLRSIERLSVTVTGDRDG